jgi:hypothetical protein
MILPLTQPTRDDSTIQALTTKQLVDFGSHAHDTPKRTKRTRLETFDAPHLFCLVEHLFLDQITPSRINRRREKSLYLFLREMEFASPLGKARDVCLLQPDLVFCRPSRAIEAKDVVLFTGGRLIHSILPTYNQRDNIEPITATAFHLGRILLFPFLCNDVEIKWLVFL